MCCGDFFPCSCQAGRNGVGGEDLAIGPWAEAVRAPRKLLSVSENTQIMNTIKSTAIFPYALGNHYINKIIMFKPYISKDAIQATVCCLQLNQWLDNLFVIKYRDSWLFKQINLFENVEIEHLECRFAQFLIKDIIKYNTVQSNARRRIKCIFLQKNQNCRLKIYIPMWPCFISLQSCH